MTVSLASDRTGGLDHQGEGIDGTAAVSVASGRNGGLDHQGEGIDGTVTVRRGERIAPAGSTTGEASTALAA